MKQKCSGESLPFLFRSEKLEVYLQAGSSGIVLFLITKSEKNHPHNST